MKAGDWQHYDGKLYYSIGEGKILRLNPDGSIPADNPVIRGIKSHV